MPMPLKAMVLIVALIVWLPAEAQFLGFGLESNIELTKLDLAIIHRTVDEQVHGKAVGTTASWSNSDSGNYGSIKLLKKYSANGRPCESVGYTMATRRMATPPEHYMLDSCLLPDGSWRIS
jgi:17 kDa outer membrane surface antigen